MDIASYFKFNPAMMVPLILVIITMFAGLIVLTRIFGIRSFSKVSAFDFAVTVAIGSIFATFITSKSPQALLGLFVLLVLYALQIGYAKLRTKIPFLRDVMDNAPRLIMADGVIIEGQLAKAKLTKGDLYAKLREANVMNFSQVIAVIAETTGDVSVLHCNDECELDAEIFDGIIGARDWLSNR